MNFTIESSIFDNWK